VTYRVELHATARAQLQGFPQAAFDALIEALAETAMDPYDPLTTLATDDPQIRRAVFGEHGLVTFYINDPAKTIAVFDITWVG
jgi:mRNA-degrading endonuclease RelE of RelBE toxin-antitoxin system